MYLRHVWAAACLLTVASADTVLVRQVLRERHITSDVANAGVSSTASSLSSLVSTASTTANVAATASSTSDNSSPVSSLMLAVSTTSDSNSASGLTTSTTGPTSSAILLIKQAATLPIEPSITPALGVAGALLITNGLAFCLVGIKHTWLHVFLGATFSGSLGVSVLIIYLMHPPVSDAIQGAYLVAAVLIGFIFGVVALVFKEITECLGCFLGGFCLAMWFLVLRPGGLVHGQTARAVLICVFAGAAMCLSFSRYTRSYGLIFCTSFAGAMITVLGIDCFSRAGLKEFWLYIWNLNSQLFPLGTTTYPLTRGIRVEVACTILLFIGGVMSQLKLWKVVKQRRASREAEVQADVESRDQLARAVGLDIEHQTERDRARWEKLYGERDKSHPRGDSGVGSSVSSFAAQKDASFTERKMGGFEMIDTAPLVRGTSQSKPKSVVLVSAVASEPDDPPISVRRDSEQQPESTTSAVEDEHVESSMDGVRDIKCRPLVSVSAADEDAAQPPAEAQSRLSHDFKSTASESPRASLPSSADEVARAQHVDVGVHAGPSIISLPFSIPREADREVHSDRDSFGSRGTAGLSVDERSPIPLSHLLLSQYNNVTPERLSREEDDLASSIAATADDDETSAQDISAIPSPFEPDHKTDGFFSLTRPGQRGSFLSLAPSGSRTPAESAIEEEDEEAIFRPPTAAKDVIPTIVKNRTSDRQPSRKPLVSSSRNSYGNNAAGDRDVDQTIEADTNSVVDLKDHLPEPLSKVAMTYRTNEWAKHIADADQPNGFERPESPSPGIQIETAFAEKPARAVHFETLQTATPPTSAPERKLSSKNTFRRSYSSEALDRRRSAGTATPVHAFNRAVSQSSLRQSGAQRPRLSTMNLSAPISSQALVESPVDDIVTDISATLIEARKERLLRRPTSTSLNELHVYASPSRTASTQYQRPRVDGSHDEPVAKKTDEDEMTLAQRKAKILNSRSLDADVRRLTRRVTGPPATTASTPVQPPSKQLIYDSHQPKRSNTVDPRRQSEMLTRWRSSLHDQPHQTSAQQQLAEAQARNVMLSQRERDAHEREQRRQARVQRESMIESAMRSGMLAGAHADALKKMQARADQAAKGN